MFVESDIKSDEHQIKRALKVPLCSDWACRIGSLHAIVDDCAGSVEFDLGPRAASNICIIGSSKATFPLHVMFPSEGAIRVP
jgi:hypothetical protein